MERYHFVTKWFFRAPIECVWAEIIDTQAWPAWWKGWKKVSLRSQERSIKVGAIADHEVKGFLPYKLRFVTQVSAVQAPRLLELTSSGDLAGRGRFELEARDGGTYVTYDWDVGTTHPVLNLLTKLPFARLLMEINHEILMEDGYKALKLRTEGPAARVQQPVYHW